MVRRGAEWQKGHVPRQLCEGEFSALTWFCCDHAAGLVIEMVRLHISCICNNIFFKLEDFLDYYIFLICFQRPFSE